MQERQSEIDMRRQKKLENPVRELEPAEEFAKAKEKALFYLHFSDKTEEEMRGKLAEQGFSLASIESAVNFLKEYHYLDDGEYSRRYVERNSGRKSRRQLQFDLKKKGIPEEILKQVMEENPVDESVQILRLLEKKQYSGEGASREERQKISAFLARKGYSYEAISDALFHYARKERE